MPCLRSDAPMELCTIRACCWLSIRWRAGHLPIVRHAGDGTKMCRPQHDSSVGDGLPRPLPSALRICSKCHFESISNNRTPLCSVVCSFWTRVAPEHGIT